MKANTNREQELVGRIHVINNQKVLLDFDLALLYEIPTKRINEQMKRNVDRFSADLMFQLTKKQWNDLRSQIATINFEMRRNHRMLLSQNNILINWKRIQTEWIIKMKHWME